MTKERLKKIMGDNIRYERLARSISIDELAEMLDLTSGFIGLIERGHRGATPYTLYRLSEIFDVQIDTLFKEHDEDALSVAEQNISPAKVKRSKIDSMIYDLRSSELDFVITVIKEIKTVRASMASEYGHDLSSTDEVSDDELLIEED